MRLRAMGLILLFGTAATTSSCDPTTTVAVPVLVITATWQVQGEEDRSFRFDADQDDSSGLEQGTFQGFEAIEGEFELTTHDLTGSWSNGAIQFTVVRPTGNVVYSGTFNQDFPSTLTLYSSGETIVLFN